MSQPTDSGDVRGRSCDCSTRLSARLLLDTRRDAVDRGARFLVCPDYVRLHAGAATDLVRATTAALEQRLDPARFMRIHRSTIVQLDRIRQLLADGHGEYVAILHGG